MAAGAVVAYTHPGGGVDDGRPPVLMFRDSLRCGTWSTRDDMGRCGRRVSMMVDRGEPPESIVSMSPGATSTSPKQFTFCRSSTGNGNLVR